MRLLIQNDDTGVYKDYTRYVVDGSLSIEDAINVPTLTTFILAATDSSFVIPKRSAYVNVVSDYYATGGGYYNGSNVKRSLATGFVTNEPEREYLGLSGSLTGKSQFGGQQFAYHMSVTSDEWQLNSRVIPYIPAFVNQTMGQILASLANAMMPDFFDVTSFVGSGDLVPYYQYSSDQTWSDVAKDFGDSVRYHYKVMNRVIYFLPFGDQASGISYDDTVANPDKNTFALQLDTGVITVPPVNDCIVLGDIEPQTNWENHFVGDGFTSQFELRHQVFDGATALLLEDDWTEDSFDLSTWTVEDPLGIFQLIGSLNVVQEGQTTPLGEEYILGINGIELGGGLNLQHGTFEFVDTCTGIVGGIYINPTLSLASNCIAGFNLTPSGTIIVTASGAAGIIIQPLYNGVPVGPQVVSQANHQYTLQTWIGSDRWDRYQRIFRNLTGSVEYGGNTLTASGDITWVITDLDQGIYAETPSYQQQFIVPQVTKYTVMDQNLPDFVVYAPVNAINLNLTIQYTLLAQPPQGSLFVRGLTGATGLQLPVLPQNLGPEIHYLMGFGQQNQTATVLAGSNSTQGVPAGGGVGTTGEAQYLAFYSDSIPGVGSRIRYQSWAAGQAIGRVRDPVAVAAEAVVIGDDGVRSAIMTNLSPLPRTSAECELAAAASVHDQEYPQFQGTYTVETQARKFENLCNPGVYGYPTAGRFFYCNSTVRAVSGMNFVINTARIQVLEMREEVLTVSVDYGMDLYLEKLLVQFEERTDSLLTPQETASPPDPIFLNDVGLTFLDNLDSATVLSIQNSTVTGNSVSFDLGQIPNGWLAEVRRVDNSWGQNNRDRLGLFSSRYFTLPRVAHDQTWFIRELNVTASGAVFSRFSKALRVNTPLIPSPPLLDILTTENLVLGLNGWTSDIYGVELRIPGLSGQYIVTVPLPPPPPGPTTQPPPPPEFFITLQEPVNAYYFPNPGANGSVPFSFPVNPATAEATALVSSLMFNAVLSTGTYDADIQPMEQSIINTQGALTYTRVPYSGADENYAMILVGTMNVAASGIYTFYITHDDGIYWAIDGVELIDQSPAHNDPYGHIQTPIMGYQFLGGSVGANNVSTPNRAVTDRYDCLLPAGPVNFEIAYTNWENEQMLVVQFATYPNGVIQNIPPDSGTNQGVSVSYNVQEFDREAATSQSNTIATCKPPLDGSPDSPILVGDILATNCTLNSSFAGLKVVSSAFVNFPASTEIGWYDIGDPFPLIVGNGTTTVGSFSLYKRGLFSSLASGGVVGGVATLYTQQNHSFNPGDVVLVGAGWGGGTPPSISSQDASFFTGQWTLTATPAPNAFQFMVNSSNPQNFNPWGLAGVAAQLSPVGTTLGPAPTGVSYILSASGVLVQRPVFAPSDLSFDLTDPSIQQFLDVAQALNPSGNFADLNAYFFNLTWDYSLPLDVTNVSAPTISGLTVDPITMNANWQIVSGQPTGHRIDTIDPNTGVTYNRFTIDHSENPQRLTQFQLSPSDFFNNRIIVVTPFNALGDGPSIAFNNPAGGLPPPNGTPGTPNLASYAIGCTWTGFIPASQIMVQLPLDQQIVFAENMFPSQGYLSVAPAATMVFLILLNYQQVGTMTFNAGSQRAVFSAPSFTVNVGDILEVIAPAGVDATAQNLGFILSTTKSITQFNLQLNLTLADDNSGSWNDAFANSFVAPQPTLQLSDTMTLTDSLAKNLFSNQLTKALADQLSMSESFSKNLGTSILQEVLADQIVLSDSYISNVPLVVQTKGGTNSVILTNNVKVGNAIIVSMGNVGSTVSSVTDTLGNTYVQVPSVAATATSCATDIWWCASSSGSGANTVTVTWAAPSSPSMNVFEVSGLTGSIDVSGRVNSGSGTGTGVSLVGTANWEFYVEECFPTHSVTAATSPWTLGTQTNGGAPAYYVGSGTQQPTFSFNTGGSFAISAAAFK